jgi:sarcosine oxidase subunit gamma
MRLSSVHDCLSRLGTVWGTLNGMPIARSVPGPANSALELFDLSALQRTGLKGPGAASWLQARNLAVPERANSWLDLSGGGLIARLGRGEFLIEDGLQGTEVKGVADALAIPAANVYPVLRQDAALMIRGEALSELLAQTCSIDLSAGALEERTVSLTMMAGIAVTLVDASSAHAAPCFRVWCDGTYGAYLWDTLLEIAVELGGGAAGLHALYPELAASGSNESNQP